MKYNMSFEGKKVLVTGASKGVGLAVAKAFAELGATVFGVARDTSSLKPVENIFFAPLDISDFKAVEDYCAKIDAIDIIVNNAAITYAKKIGDISLDEWQNVIAINLTAPFFLIKQLRSKIRPGGSIVNVSSIAGRNKSIVAGVHYTASKAGLIGLTRQLAHELGPVGIRVNCICPSQTLTDMLKQAMADEDLQKLASTIPLRRLASVEDVVNSIIFLASDKSGYINGSVIDINGGQL